VFFQLQIFFNFWSSKPWIRIWIAIQPKMPDPDLEAMNREKLGKQNSFSVMDPDPDPYRTVSEG
jgi:hypothetical protein